MLTIDETQAISHATEQQTQERRIVEGDLLRDELKAHCKE